MRVRFRLCLFSVLSLTMVVGCGGAKIENAPRVPVSGEVKLDNKPLMIGNITFDPGNGEPPTTIEIIDGKYDGKAPVGKNKVKLTATKKTTMKKELGTDGPGYDETIEINMLPSRYNDGWTKEVSEGDTNTFNFDLKSK